jgi:hypothetical protein
MIKIERMPCALAEKHEKGRLSSAIAFAKWIDGVEGGQEMRRPRREAVGR